MSFDTLLDSTADVLTISDTGNRDAYNVPTQGEASVASYPCRIQETSTNEIIGGRDTTVSQLTLFLPAEAVISRGDRVVVDGVTYDVVGDPNAVHGFSGVHHIEVRVQEVHE